MSLMPIPYYVPPAGGIGSIDFERDNGECLKSTTNIANIGAGDFTWEAWIKPETTGSTLSIMGISRGGGRDILFLDQDFFGPLIRAQLGGTNTTSHSFTYSVGIWYHVAVTRNSGSVDIWVDGSSLGADTITNNLTANCNIILGTAESDSAFATFDGKIALARWSSTAKYTASFTPATDYGVEGDTLALVGSFDGGSTYEDASGNFTLVAADTNTPTADAEAPS